MFRSAIESVDELKIMKKIGQGKSAEVFMVRDIFSNSYALKRLRRCFCAKGEMSGNSQADNSLSKNLWNEVSILRELGSHPHITPMIFWEEDAIVMELQRNGELFDYISLGSDLFDEEMARYYFRQLISAVEFMHNAGYAHRDIKPENMLMDERFDMKLSDFGFSCKQQEGETLNRILGTDGYMAPELILHQGYDGFKTDIFAMGVVLFCMVNGFPPYFKQACPDDPYYRFFVERRAHVYWQCMQRKYNIIYSNEFMSLITGMLAFNPSERLELSQIKNHPWYTSPCSLTTEEVILRMTQIRSQINNH